jgi:hypothetical protein
MICKLFHRWFWWKWIGGNSSTGNPRYDIKRKKFCTKCKREVE